VVLTAVCIKAHGMTRERIAARTRQLVAYQARGSRTANQRLLRWMHARDEREHVWRNCYSLDSLCPVHQPRVR
jgi:hypothetical protein